MRPRTGMPGEKRAGAQRGKARQTAGFVYCTLLLRPDWAWPSPTLSPTLCPAPTDPVPALARSVSVCMYVCNIYIYIHTYIHTYIYTYKAFCLSGLAAQGDGGRRGREGTWVKPCWRASQPDPCPPSSRQSLRMLSLPAGGRQGTAGRSPHTPRTPRTRTGEDLKDGLAVEPRDVRLPYCLLLLHIPPYLTGVQYLDPHLRARHAEQDERKEQREREKPKWARKEASEHVATARVEHEGAQCWR